MLSAVVVMGSFSLLPAHAADSLRCAIAPPGAGFGSPGHRPVRHDSIASPLWPRRSVHLFCPADSPGPFPLILFLHTYGEEHPVVYDRLVNNLAGRGYAVLYPPTRAVTFTRRQLSKYRMAYEGIDTALTTFGALLDTTRLGIVAHGFGAGMAPSLARRLLVERRWGEAGAFMFLMAPWYVYGMDERQMRAFPRHVQMVVQVYEDDRINDPRIAADIFQTLGIPDSSKDFMIIPSDSRGGCRLRATHDVPLSARAFGGEDNALDWYAVHRTAGALAAWAFARDPAARIIALGNGAPSQVFLGTWPDGAPVKAAIVTDIPRTYVGKGRYLNEWRSPRNPRIETSLFKKARKIFVKHWQAKIGAAVSTAAGKARAKRFAEADSLELGANPIVEGYGADGEFVWTADSFANPLDPAMNVYVFMPQGTPAPPPVLFLIPGYSGADPFLFEPFLSHVLSRGMAVIVPPYPILPTVDEPRRVLEKLEIVRAGMRAAMARYASRLDTARTGFMGQSFGGGLAPVLAYQTITGAGWGREGAFMFLTAPWYCYDMSPERLRSFPSHVKLLVQIYDDDDVNDHAIAADLFEHIAIPASEKDFVLVYSDSTEGMKARADHFVPYGTRHINGTVNVLDYYAVFRLFDALAAYALDGDSAAKAVALGHGSPQQRYMGEWAPGKPVRELASLAHYEPVYPQLRYLWAWDNPINPRRTIARFRSAR